MKQTNLVKYVIRTVVTVVGITATVAWAMISASTLADGDPNVIFAVFIGCVLLSGGALEATERWRIEP